jgi:hypothetical protein
MRVLTDRCDGIRRLVHPSRTHQSGHDVRCIMRDPGCSARCGQSDRSRRFRATSSKLIRSSGRHTRVMPSFTSLESSRRNPPRDYPRVRARSGNDEHGGRGIARRSRAVHSYECERRVEFRKDRLSADEMGGRAARPECGIQALDDLPADACLRRSGPGRPEFATILLRKLIRPFPVLPIFGDGRYRLSS